MPAATYQPALYLPPGARLAANDPLFVGCLGYWGFGEGSAQGNMGLGFSSGFTQVADLTGRGNTLSWAPLAGTTPQYGPGLLGGGLYNATGASFAAQASQTNAGIWQPSAGTNTFSYACWFRRNDTTSTGIAFGANGMTGGSTTMGWLTAVLGGLVLQFAVSQNGISNNTSLTTAATYSDTGWHHLAVTYRYVTSGTSQMRIWVDGRLGASSNTAVGPVFNTGWPLVVGARYNLNVNSLAWGWKGGIDEAGYWTRVLADDEIRRLALDPLSVYVADWRMAGRGAGNARLWSLGIPGIVAETVTGTATATASLATSVAVTPALAATATSTATLAPYIPVPVALAAAATATSWAAIAPATVVLVGPLTATATAPATLVPSLVKAQHLTASAAGSATLTVTLHYRTAPDSTSIGVQAAAILTRVQVGQPTTPATTVSTVLPAS
jgi:hypothetical protein